MSGQIEASANDIFDYLITDGNEDLRRTTKRIVDGNVKVGDLGINAWRASVLPVINAQASRGIITTFLGQKPIDKFHLKRVIGCALRRFKRENESFKN